MVHKKETPGKRGVARGGRPPRRRKTREHEISRARGPRSISGGSEGRVLFDNYANAGMIVGQYVRGIKVESRSNSVIFMIPGAGVVEAGEGEVLDLHREASSFPFPSLNNTACRQLQN